MVQQIDTLQEVAHRYGAIVLDQWGVLHDGSAPYCNAIACLTDLKRAGLRLAVLSNSGKRAEPNAARITAMGFDAELFDVVMTSGEALWLDLAQGRVEARSFCPIERDIGDGAAWAKGLDIALTDDPAQADAILLMGLPDGADPAQYHDFTTIARVRDIPVLCTNPDRASPRAGGVTVVSPGTLAHDHADRGGRVEFYGKPHLPVFCAVEAALGLPPERLLMVGDSLEHDIAGAKGAGWDALFIAGGLHAAAFTGTEPPGKVIARLARTEGTALPDFTLPELC